MNNGDWHYDGMGGGNWWWMSIMMFVVLGGLMWIGITLARQGAHTPHPQIQGAPTPPARATPQEILAERLARGEIEPDDYRQRLNALQATPRE